jgi:NAD(P) transhydrogenase subunit alpha
MWLGFVALILATINVVGGYIVTDRMLAMFKKKGK